MSTEVDDFLALIRDRCPRLRTHLPGMATWELEALVSATAKAIEDELDALVVQQVLQAGGR